MIVVWVAAMSVFGGVVAAFVRDVPHAVQLLLRVGFFATPVMYDESFIPPALRWTASLNPVAVAIDGLRDTLLCGRMPDMPLQLTHLVLAATLLVGAQLYTKSVEARIADVV